MIGSRSLCWRVEIHHAAPSLKVDVDTAIQVGALQRESWRRDAVGDSAAAAAALVDDVDSERRSAERCWRQLQGESPRVVVAVAAKAAVVAVAAADALAAALAVNEDCSQQSIFAGSPLMTFCRGLRY